MEKNKRDDLVGELFAKDCKVLDVSGKKVIVKNTENKIIANMSGKVEKGDVVEIYKTPFLSKLAEILLYLSPLYYLIVGFAFGFLFHNHTCHYLLIVGCAMLGFIQLVVCKFLIDRYPKYKFVAKKVVDSEKIQESVVIKNDIVTTIEIKETEKKENENETDK